MRLLVGVYRIGRVVLVFGVGLAVMSYFVKTKPKPASSAYEDKGVLVETQSVRPQALPFTVSAFGTAKPKRQSNIVAEVAGRIVEKAPGLEEGARFEEGQTLFRIDPADYKLQLLQLQGQLHELKASEQELQAQHQNALELKALAERDAQLARRDVERVRELLKSKMVAQEEADKAERQLVNATTSLQTAENTIRLFPSREQSLKAKVAAMQAMVEKAQLQLERTEVRAPFTGRVLSENAEIGEYVQPGKQLVTLWDISALEIAVNLPASDVTWIVPDASNEGVEAWMAGKTASGQKLPAWLPRAEAFVQSGQREHVWQGYLRSFGGRIDQETRTVPAVVEIPASGQEQASPSGSGRPELLPGAFCRVEIQGRELKDIYVLPRSAVALDEHVWVVEKDRLRRKAVKVLRSEKQLAYAAALEEAAHQAPPKGAAQASAKDAAQAPPKENGRPGADHDEAPSPSIRPGDQVVVSQMAAPAEGMIVRVGKQADASAPGAASAAGASDGKKN